MTTPVEASRHPGMPEIFYAASLANPYAYEPTGFAAWHSYWDVWVRLEPGAAFGVRAPVDSIRLTPDPPPDGASDLAAKIEQLQQQIEQLRRGPRRAS